MRIIRFLQRMLCFQRVHVAHSSYWVDGSDGRAHPETNTIITLANVQAEKWKPRKPELMVHFIKYVTITLSLCFHSNSVTTCYTNAICSSVLVASPEPTVIDLAQSIT